MEMPQIRPGLVKDEGPLPRIIAFFPNAAEGNVTIQRLVVLGIHGDRIAVTPPEQLDGGQGMVVSIGCHDPALFNQVEDLCRHHGAQIHRSRR